MTAKLTMKSYSVGTITPLKRPAIWAVCEPNQVRPLVYLQRPKWVSDEQWARILKAIKIDAEPGMLNCGGES